MNQYLEVMAQKERNAAYNQYFPSPGAENKYGYVQPGNPVIPLNTGSEDQDYISGKLIDFNSFMIYELSCNRSDESQKYRIKISSALG